VATPHDGAASQLPHGLGPSDSPLSSPQILVFIPFDFICHTIIEPRCTCGHSLLDPYIIIGKSLATMAPKYPALKRTFDQRITGFFSKAEDKTTNINTATPNTVASRSSPDLSDPPGDVHCPRSATLSCRATASIFWMEPQYRRGHLLRISDALEWRRCRSEGLHDH
jgi:hypothetical protein